MKNIIVCIIVSIAANISAESFNATSTLLHKLEKTIVQVQTLETRFIQEKITSMIEHPIILTGKLYLKKDDLFAWHVYEPEQYSIVVNKDIIERWDSKTDTVKRIPLKKNRAMMGFVFQIREWLSGKYTSMQDVYTITVLSSEPIELEFKPKKRNSTSAYINRIKIVFKKDHQYVQQVTIEEKKGNKTSIMFFDTVINHIIDKSAWEARQDVR